MIELTNWSEWTTCSRTCGSGERTRTRKCNDQTSSRDKNNPCKENLFEREICNSQKCPVYTEWSSWSSCSLTCGGGSQERTRICIQPTRAVFTNSFSEANSKKKVTCIGDPSEVRQVYSFWFWQLVEVHRVFKIGSYFIFLLLICNILGNVMKILALLGHHGQHGHHALLRVEAGLMIEQESVFWKQTLRIRKT